MAIRYRRAADGNSPAREGEVESLGELEALVTLGSLTARDEVALDGVTFKKATRVPELKQALREKPPDSSGLAGDLVLGGVLAVAGLAGLMLVLRLFFFTGKLVLMAGLGAAAVWGVLRLVRALRKP
jgi:hypothetical protein